MKKNISFFGFVFLLLINILLASIVVMKTRDIRFLNIKILEFEAKDRYTSLKIEHYSKVVKWLQKTNPTSFSLNQTLQNEQGDTVHFYDLVGGKPKLVFRYSELNCNVCVDSQIDFIKEFVNRYGYDNLIMISNYKYKRNLSLFKILNNINNEIYNMNVLDSSLDVLNIPYYFILDEQPTMFHFPEKFFPEDTKEYFKSIDNQYF
jgi:hypothetical protein